MAKKNYNLFSLNGDSVADQKIIDLLNLPAGTEHTPQLNIDLLEQARAAQVAEYPREADEINAMFDKAIYYMKVKLAARGLFHQTHVEEDDYGR